MRYIKKFQDLETLKNQNVKVFLKDKMEVIYKHLGEACSVEEFNLENDFGVIIEIEKKSEVFWKENNLKIIDGVNELTYIPEWKENLIIGKENYFNFCISIGKNKVAEVLVKKAYL